MNQRRATFLSLPGLGLAAAVAAGWRAAAPPQSSACFPTPLPRSARAATPSARSLRQAWTLRTRARLAEDRQREAMESWDPPATAGLASEALRRADLARDPEGELRRARAAVRQAVTLARTPLEEYRARWLLGRIDNDLGEHLAELEEARRLMLLAPLNPRSLEALRNAQRTMPVPLLPRAVHRISLRGIRTTLHLASRLAAQRTSRRWCSP